MAAPLNLPKAGKTPIFFIFCTLSLFIGSCASSSRLSPRYSSTAPTALLVDSLAPADPAIEALIKPYKATLDVSMDSIIGYAAEELQKQEVESALGNFVADLTREAAEGVTDFPVDMGMVTIGGLRVPLPQGPIRIGDLYELMPFENMIVVLRLSGQQALQLFEFAASKKIVAIANSKIVVQNGKPVKIFIGGEPFDPARTYTLATSDYLAGGGDNLTFLKEAEVLQNTDILLRSAITNKVVALQKEGKKVEAQIEGRVEVIE